MLSWAQAGAEEEEAVPAPKEPVTLGVGPEQLGGPQN